MAMPLSRQSAKSSTIGFRQVKGNSVVSLVSYIRWMGSLQDKLQGGTESGIRTIKNFLGFSMKENQLHTRHWELTTIFVNACWKMDQRNDRFRSNDGQVLQICYQLT